MLRKKEDGELAWLNLNTIDEIGVTIERCDNSITKVFFQLDEHIVNFFSLVSPKRYMIMPIRILLCTKIGLSNAHIAIMSKYMLN